MRHSSRARGRLVAVLGILTPILGTACSRGVPREAPSPVQTEMQGHFFEAQELQAGAIFGDLARLKRAATRLESAMARTRLPPSAASRTAELRAAARTAADAEDAAAARRAAAAVAASCGSCHRQFRTGPAIVIGSAPQGESLRQHMARQERNSRLLWAGLISPSNQDWMAGARHLVEAPPFPPEITTRVRDAELLDAAHAELQALGREAEGTTEDAARAELLARVWGVCSGCHQVAGLIGP